MVPVGHKPVTQRTATAKGRVHLGQTAFHLVAANKLKKGDVLTVAQIAGINAAKQTGYLVPLCHPLLLSHISVNLTLVAEEHSVDITGRVECTGTTGVEVEAIMAVSVAAVTVYDMCKAVNKGIVIGEVRLMSKDGGNSGSFSREEK
jgi:GTP 3',8-cyclase / cyclic pyranopterin monophosphate synthase